MSKIKIPLGLALVLVLGLCANLWASDKTAGPARDLLVRHRLYLQKISCLLSKGAKTCLPPYLWSPEKSQESDRLITAAGGISGRVTKAAGGGILGVTVRASKVTCPDYSDNTTTDADGYYTISGLPAGLYEVWTDNDSDFVDIYWDDKTSENSDTVIVSGSVVPNIDFSLRVGGKITGKLTLTGSSLVMSVFIYAFNATTMETFIDIPISYTTDTVTYVIRRLPTGSYKLKTYNMMGFIDGQGYIDEYYNDKVSMATADLVSVIEGSTNSGKDITLVRGGIIEGTVTSASKAPLEDIEILGFHVEYPTDWIILGYTDDNGDYSLYGLRSGNWKIFAIGDTTYEWEWYNNKSGWNSATDVSVSGTSTFSGKDFTLSIGGSISGYVYDMGSSPLQDCDVAAYETSFVYGGIAVKGDETSITGSYKITGLRSGGYKVQASDGCSEQWFDQETSYLTADIVGVTQPGNTPSINFNLPSDVEDEAEEVVSRIEEFELCQNYPNPFNPVTAIEYTLQKKAQVNLEIYNLLGQKVTTLVNEDQSPGSHRIQWDGKNEQGKTIASGIYFYKLEVNGVSQTKRMVLLK